jgi:hypothetical protein
VLAAVDPQSYRHRASIRRPGQASQKALLGRARGRRGSGNVDAQTRPAVDTLLTFSAPGPEAPDEPFFEFSVS